MTANTRATRADIAALALLGAIIILALVAGVRVAGTGIKIDTSLAQALPAAAQDPVLIEVDRRRQEAGAGRIVIVIRGNDAERASMRQATLARVAAQTNLSPDTNLLRADSALDALAAMRFDLLAAEDRDYLQNGHQAVIVARMQRTLFGFPADPPLLPFKDDPAGFFAAWMASQTGARQIVDAGDGYVTVRSTASSYLADIIVLTSTGATDLDSLTATRHFVAELGSIATDTEWFAAGIPLHVADAVDTARTEVTIISLGSTIAILMLFLTAFRALRPLIFSLACVLFGCAFATVMTAAAFDRLHIFTLVFGASLIGVGVDYALHFLCMGDKSRVTHLRTTSLVALGSTTVAYGMLGTTDMALIRQIALFSAAGLCACWTSVVALYPFVIAPRTVMSSSTDAASPTPLSRVSRSMARPVSYYLGLWGRSSRAAYVLTLLAIWTVAGLTLVNYGRVSDDLRTLHRPNPHLVANDLALQAQLSLPAVNQYFLVTGDNADDLLRRMGSLAPQLNALVAAGAISSYESPRDRLPIASERAQNRALIEAAYGDTGWIYAAVDLDPTAVQQLQTALIASPRATARAIDEALRLVAPDLWFGTVNGVNVGAIALHNVADINALRALPVPGRTQFVDVPGSWSASLAGELHDSVGLLGASFIVIISGLVIWTRRLSGAVIALVPATSAAVTFAALTALDIPLTLFHLFGAYLILGLGLDYGIFMWGAGGQDNDCAAAILLSAATTIVSFGLLSASATPMVQSFGITIFLGTVMNVFLVPGLRYFRGPAGSSTDPRSS